MRTGGFLRGAAQILWWVGLAMVIGGGALLALGLRLPGGLLLGGGLAALGLNAALGGELIAGGEPRPFTVRGTVVRGHLTARCGLADLVVSRAGSDRVASVIYGPIGKPDFEVQDGIARLGLIQPLGGLNISRWRADLAGNVLWDIEVRGVLGEFNLDLSGLRLERISIQTTLGRMRIACPARGYTQMELRTAGGEIELHIPPDVGAKITIKRGPLCDVVMRTDRLTASRRDRYASEDFESAPAQVEVHIEATAGDVILA